MQVKLIGLGSSGEQLTQEAKRAIEEAELILGASRMLASLPPHSACTKEAYLPRELCRILCEEKVKLACVIFSGDTGFYSGVKALLPLLQEAGISAEILPGISSLQSFAARLGRPWQEWNLCSAHGISCDIRKEIMTGKACFFLTGGEQTPGSICTELTEAGLGDLTVFVGENLGYPEEAVTSGAASELMKRSFAPLSVMLTESAPVWADRIPGIPDEQFIRGNVPMTKREVRAAILSLLRVTPEDVCWDIGAGTGSVSVELALHSRAVWAVERNADAIALMEQNRLRFGAWNLRMVEAEAPFGMEHFPAPDAVFVGGSGGNLQEILALVKEKNPKARICVSAIALETLSSAVSQLESLGYTVSVTQLAVSRTKPAGELHLLMALNPIFLIMGEVK